MKPLLYNVYNHYILPCLNHPMVTSLFYVKLARIIRVERTSSEQIHDPTLPIRIKLLLLLILESNRYR